MSMFSTGVTSINIIQRKTMMLSYLHECFDCLFDGREPDIDRVAHPPEGMSTRNPYPLVCIINGAGESGKDTFVNMVSSYTVRPVHNISCVDPVRKCVQDLMETTEIYGELVRGKTPETVKEVVGSKEMKYRKFLSDVKAAWDEYDNGGNYTALGKLANGINEGIKEGNLPSIVFIHCREKKNVEFLCDVLTRKMGLIPIKLLIKGRSDPRKFTNDSDRLVEEIDYDLVVSNTSRFNTLELKARAFGCICEIANYSYGINCNVPVSTEE